MKNIKLHNVLLCRLIIYFPFFAPFFASLLLRIASLRFTAFGTAIIIILSVYAVIYGTINIATVITSIGALHKIKMWKMSRTWYKSKKNGTEAPEVEKRILSRCRIYGDEYEVLNSSLKPSGLFYSVRRVVNLFLSCVEKYSIVYTVKHLDRSKYNDILSSARANSDMLHIPDKLAREHFKDSKRVGKAIAIIIISETMDAEVTDCIYKLREMNGINCFLPCIYVAKDLKYYVNTLCIIKGSVCKIAFKHIKKTVFGNKLSIKENDERLPYDDLRFSPNLTIGEFKSRTNSGIMPTKEKKAAKRLKNREVAFVENNVCCKINDEFVICPMEEKSMSGTARVYIPAKWSSSSNLISYKDLADIEKLIAIFLRDNDCSYEIITEEIFRGKRKNQSKK